jgi:hypothetical protein
MQHNDVEPEGFDGPAANAACRCGFFAFKPHPLVIAGGKRAVECLK